MKLKFNSLSRAARAGFSLIELLIVIAVIGIMASIALPQIGKINYQAKVSRAKKDAGEVATVYNSAIAAGYYPTGTVTPTAIVMACDPAAAADSIVGTGQFKDTHFRVPGAAIAENETDAAHKPSTYLTWDDSQKSLIVNITE
jgi:type IV pilus assembly protein PilA